ncbi:RNA polymerase sigma24 factor [Actinokineospora sp. NBRC 105648]|nr:RNA polymerase sigma24 factor [Actinokineospora sp. NBRC 105648]
MSVGDLVRGLAPRVLGAVVRRYGHFDAAEDAVQEALIAAAAQWPVDGTPDDPLAWLVRVAANKLVDALRSDGARRRREETVGAEAPVVSPAADEDRVDSDDTLVLLFLCCHPALTPEAQIPLTLRAVGGLTTEEIARAFLVPPATMAKRITRAKQRVKASGIGFRLPPPAERADRLGAVLHVLYLVFNEGYTGREELAAEAIRLARAVHRALPGDGEVTGLLALMLLTDARRAARTGPGGALVPLADQDRDLWDEAAIAEGSRLAAVALTRDPVFGPYQLQAAIAAVHDEARTAAETDWAQILALYHLLEQVSENPVVTLNRAVATAMAHGPAEGLDLLDTLADDPRVAGHHRLVAVRAHLLAMAGDHAAASEHYRAAARLTLSAPERDYLLAKARLSASSAGPPLSRRKRPS